MSQVPHYVSARIGQKLGDVKMRDGMVLDGLTDVYNQTHMGNCSELCAKEHNFSREEQDAFAIESYKRSAQPGRTESSPMRWCRWRSSTKRRSGRLRSR